MVSETAELHLVLPDGGVDLCSVELLVEHKAVLVLGSGEIGGAGEGTSAEKSANGAKSER